MQPTFKVPIRNVFCMLSYTATMPEFIHTFSDVEDDLITYDLLAKMFNDEVEVLLYRGLMRDYQEKTEETSFISGRMLMSESIPFMAERRPVVVCEKDDYSTNIGLNQILKSTLRGLYQNRAVEQQRRHRSFMYSEEMPMVEEVILSRGVFQRLTFNRHNVHYKRVIHMARLLYELELLSHQSGDWSLVNVDMSQSDLNRLFEDFLFHFYRIHKGEYRVTSERMQWKLEGNRALLPSMLTDVSLTHRFESEKVIVDAKFYKNTFQSFHDKASFHSHNMYQLFTYLMHQSKDIERLRGILIYPFNGVNVSEVYRWDDRMTVEIATVHLDRTWNDVEAELMEVLA